MAKRKVAVDSDDEVQDILSQHSKRARTVDSEEDIIDHSQLRNRNAKGKGKARQEDSDDDDEEDEDDEGQNKEEHNEEEEQRFEELNGEAIRQRLEQKRNTFGVSRMLTASVRAAS